MIGRLSGRLLLGCVVPLVTGAGPTSPVRHRVDIRGLAFHPRDLVVAVGDTVRWVNDDVVPHTVTFGDGAADRDEVAPGNRFTLIVGARQTLSYRCRYHPSMTGTVVAR
ncbi:MAG TPA: plastocyanin/azurin family copper-binding protein [Gemmatimonadales bacterium]|nr:plastocyanin/azurin family copper-binding protein [Gemmatimonadales bacterium]